MYKKVIFHYYSGTGNSFTIAKHMIDIAKKTGAVTSIVPVEKYEDESLKISLQKNENKTTLLGFFMPTHGFTAPWKFFKHVLGLPKGNGTNVIVTATRAGLKFGKLYVPGISGSGTYITTLILRLKGYKPRGITSIDMPSNWMSLHPAQKIKSQKAIIKRGILKAENFINIILEGKTVWLTRTNIFEFIWTITLTWISLAYFLYGRFVLSKLFFANYKCTSCRICALHCPTGSIKMIGKKNPLPYWKYSCESCMRCMGFCPTKAIETGHSWGALLYLIGSIPAFIVFLNYINGILTPFLGISTPLIVTAIRWFIWLMAIFASYHLFHFLLRVPIINRFFSWTTLTHFYRRYHVPELRITEFKKYDSLDKK